MKSNEASKENASELIDDDIEIDVIANMQSIVEKALKDEAPQKPNPKFIADNKAERPQPRGKLLAHEKRQTARRIYAKKRDGSAFIENDRILYAANIVAKNLAHTGASEDDVLSELSEFIKANDFELTEDQKENLANYTQRRIGDFEALERVDRAVLDQSDKDLWFLWGLIKRDFALNDKIIKSREQWRKQLNVGPAKIGPLFEKLIHLKAVKRLGAGKKAAGSKVASQYKRLV